MKTKHMKQVFLMMYNKMYSYLIYILYIFKNIYGIKKKSYFSKYLNIFYYFILDISFRKQCIFEI